MSAELGARNAEAGKLARATSGATAGSADLLLNRTTDFAMRVIRMVESLPSTRTADVLGKQVLRAATSVGANYRAARRARSQAEFCAKLGIVEEEADECSYWFDLLVRSGIVGERKLAGLMQGAGEITAMVVASIRTARRKANPAK